MGLLVGTAGHVDHGKTTLIAALTGIDADRLPDEKRRGMTIDLGFAFLDLADGRRVSIVDVPGHERLVTNMLAGATGVDVALLCVAADEGPMPQTREHLAILELLPVRSLLVALTRADLADADRRREALAEVELLLAETRFAGAPTVAVSAVTGEGLPELVETLTRTLDQTPSRPPGQGWMLPIDRAFVVKGHGAVVTGTLLKGSVSVGMDAVVQPGERPVKVRGLQRHSVSVESAEPGDRVAINLGGIAVEELERGMLVGAPGVVSATSRLGIEVRVVGAIKAGQRVRVHVGAGDQLARAFPVESGWRLEFSELVAAAVGQPVILRHPSAGALLAGGTVVDTDPSAGRRAKVDPAEEVRQRVAASPFGCDTERLVRRMRMTSQELGPVIEQLRRGGQLVGQGGVWWTPETWDATRQLVLTTLGRLHEEKPATPAHHMVKVAEEAGLPWRGKALLRLFQAMGAEVALAGETVWRRDFRVGLNTAQRALLDRILAEMERTPASPPSPAEIAQTLRVPEPAVDAMVRLGLARGEMFESGGLIFSTQGVRTALDQARKALGDKPFTVSQFRESVHSTRKFVVPLLEYLDGVGVTQRTGDLRTFRAPKAE